MQALGVFLNALPRGKLKGEFASIFTGSWQQSSSWEHGEAPGFLAGQRQTLASFLALTVIDIKNV